MKYIFPRSISLTAARMPSLAARHLVLLLLLILATGSLAARQAQARTQSSPGTACTEAAFDAALAALPTGGTLTFNCGAPAKITFTTTKYIARQVTIDGSNGGGTEVTLDGSGTVQLFQVYTNNGTNGNLSVSHLTLSNGNAGAGCGGAILGAYGPVFAQNVTFKNNTANYGGAICGGSQNGIDGSVTVRDSTFDSNVALAGGGAIESNGAYSLKIYSSTFNNNAAQAVLWAGDMYVAGSNFTSNSTAGCTSSPCDGAALSGGQGVTTTVTGSRFINNHSPSHNGGAIGGSFVGTLIIDHTLFDGNSALDGGAIGASFGGPASIYVSDSSFQHNTAANNGGAIANSGPNSINRTLFFDNHATGGASVGGAVDGTINGQATTLTNTTFYQNSAAYGGALGGRGALSIRLSTFVSNTATVTGSVLYDDAAYAHIDSIAQSVLSGSSSCATPGSSVVSGGYNIASDSTCNLAAVGDQLNTNPRLAPFQNAGGYSWSMPPYSNSPAVDIVPLAACAAAVDQRRTSRPIGPACDAGAVEGNFGDVDADGLLDEWEVNGVMIDGGAGPQFINLPAMGADPNKPDIFLQIDWMQDGTHNQKLDPAALKIVVDAFANSPYVSPTGTHGINLHIDQGPDSIMNYTTGATWGALSKAHAIPYVASLGTFDGNNNYVWTAFQAIKDAPGGFTQSGRTPIFHYIIAAHNYGTNNTSSGISRGVSASDLIVSLGSFPNGVGTVNQQAGTLMHELGHNLNLHHGGDDDNNFKPNYLSIMSYAFQFQGVAKGKFDGTFDYSRSALVTLDKTNLNESAGLGASATGYGTRHYCVGTDTYVPDTSVAIDWNCNGSSTDVGVVYDINNDGVCVSAGKNGVLDTVPAGDDVIVGTTIRDGVNRKCDSTAAGDDVQERSVGYVQPSLLTGYNDWLNVKLKGGGIGLYGISAVLPMTTEADLLTVELASKIIPFPPGKLFLPFILR